MTLSRQVPVPGRLGLICTAPWIVAKLYRLCYFLFRAFAPGGLYTTLWTSFIGHGTNALDVDGARLSPTTPISTHLGGVTVCVGSMPCYHKLSPGVLHACIVRYLYFVPVSTGTKIQRVSKLLEQNFFQEEPVR
jgi:hypothetical protein